MFPAGSPEGSASENTPEGAEQVTRAHSYLIELILKHFLRQQQCEAFG